MRESGVINLLAPSQKLEQKYGMIVKLNKIKGDKNVITTR
jgi:hypothetical protein